MTKRVTTHHGMKNDTSTGTSFELLTNTFMHWNLTLVDTNLLHESINMRAERSEKREVREREREHIRY